MLKSYFKIAVRNLFKNKLTSFINIFGLGLSMSIGMMIMIRLQDQLSYDDFHPSPERTYRITSHYAKSNGEKLNMASTALPLHTSLSRDATSIESIATIYPAFHGKATAAGKEIYLNGAFTEPSFFNVFGFSLASGNPHTALQQPNTIVLGKETAEKFFGKTDPMGQVVSMENGSSFIVTGILNQPPGKSHISYEALVSYSSVQQLEKDKLLPERSTDPYAFNAAYTYVLLKKESSLSVLDRELNAIAAGLNKDNKNGTTSFNTQNIGSITPGSSNLSNQTGNGTSWSKVYFEIGVSLLILLAACFNYTNLTIARALTRAKETGIRKIVGAKRYQLFTQYIVESVSIALLALVFAWLILSFIIEYAPFNDGYEFIPSSFRYNPELIGWSLAFAIFSGLIAGASPAWILSSFTPLRVLKNMSTARILGKVSIQKSLIVFQYSLSLVLIIFLFTFYRQFSFIGKADPGFRRDHMMLVSLNGADKDIAMQKIAAVSGVQRVSGLSSDLTKRFNGMNASVWITDSRESVNLNYYYADTGFIPGMQLQLAAGNNFPATTEDSHEQYIILNEKAVRALGMKNNQEAIGRKLWINDSTSLEVAGVLRDFNYENMGIPIRPLALRSKKNAYSYLYISMDQSDKEAAAKRIAQAWAGMGKSLPFTYVWLDEELDKGNSQIATISLLGFLAFIALSIASLGLLGLVLYTVETKRKEISIRKIIGADKKQIIHMLSRGFIILLLIAGLIAMPVGYMAGYLFLQGFANRVSFGLPPVIACFLFLLAIGLITIISQTYKAAAANPAENLRTE